MADRMVKALMLAIKQGGIRDLSYEDQCLVAKAIQVIRSLPPRFDQIIQDTPGEPTKPG